MAPKLPRSGLVINFKWPSLVCVSAAVALLAACSNRPAPADAKTVRPVPAVAHGSAGQTDGLTDGLTDGQTASQTVSQTASRTVGTVVETMNASNYTYVRVKTDSGDVWAAASQFKVAVGDRVVFTRDQPMENFHSQALKRDFPLIYFVSDMRREGDAASQATPAGHPPVEAGQAAPAAPAVATPLDPPKDGMTIASVWKTRNALTGKTVTVRGKVVKFNGGILGVNWIHLQDGSGSAADGTNDITVTSDADTRVGDVITVTGVVGLNKDLGAGYNYPVIIEHARIVGK